MNDNIWIIVLAMWALASPFMGLLAGYCLHRYGHGRCEPRAPLNDKERAALHREQRRIAAGLARTNRMEVK